MIERRQFELTMLSACGGISYGTGSFSLTRCWLARETPTRIIRYTLAMVLVYGFSHRCLIKTLLGTCLFASLLLFTTGTSWLIMLTMMCLGSGCSYEPPGSEKASVRGAIIREDIRVR